MKRLAGKPFALLGVNSDEDRKVLRTVIAREKIVWRSWFDGGSPEGPISTRWQVSSWTTLYVIDGKGIVRHVDEGGAEVNIKAAEAVVDRLLRESASKQ